MERVVIYRILLDVPPQAFGLLHGYLSPDELSRSERFHYPLERQRFVSAHGQLRVVLGRLLGKAPEALRFRYGPQGKPFLDGSSGDLFFSLSHSGPLAIIGVAETSRVGVDIEQVEPDLDVAEAAEQLFSPDESEAARSLLPADWSAAFFRSWTRKESLLKARGDGLSMDPRELSLLPFISRAPLEVRDPWGGEPVWTILDVSVAGPFCAAATLEGRGDVSVAYHA